MLPDGKRIPDPASSFQPEGPDGPSEVLDHSAYRWRDQRWRGLPWHTTILYEVDVGAFSAAGTFNALREQLRKLVRLGITAIQLGPIATLPYAPDHRYGTPDDLKGLVEEAHGLGLMVLLTVGHSQLARDFAIGNALYWLEKYRFDGLRFANGYPQETLTELAEVLRTRITQREVHLILESEEIETSLLQRSHSGEIALYNAQWRDDLHRALLAGAEGAPGAHLPPDAFVTGHRPERASDPERRALISTQLLMPQIPLLIMGEDWDAADERYRWLLELRHREIIPRIPSIEQGGTVRQLAPGAVEVTWRVGTVEDLVLVANLSGEFAAVPLPKGRVLWLEGSRGASGLHSWSVLWTVRLAAA